MSSSTNIDNNNSDKIVFDQQKNENMKFVLIEPNHEFANWYVWKKYDYFLEFKIDVYQVFNSNSENNKNIISPSSNNNDNNNTLKYSWLLNVENLHDEKLVNTYQTKYKKINKLLNNIKEGKLKGTGKILYDGTWILLSLTELINNLSLKENVDYTGIDEFKKQLCYSIIDDINDNDISSNDNNASSSSSSSNIDNSKISNRNHKKEKLLAVEYNDYQYMYAMFKKENNFKESSNPYVHIIDFDDDYNNESNRDIKNNDNENIIDDDLAYEEILVSVDSDTSMFFMFLRNLQKTTFVLEQGNLSLVDSMNTDLVFGISYYKDSGFKLEVDKIVLTWIITKSYPQLYVQREDKLITSSFNIKQFISDKYKNLFCKSAEGGQDDLYVVIDNKKWISFGIPQYNEYKKKFEIAFKKEPKDIIKHNKVFKNQQSNI